MYDHSKDSQPMKKQDIGGGEEVAVTLKNQQTAAFLRQTSGCLK